MSENNGRAIALTPASAPLANKLEMDGERMALLSRTLGASLHKDELHLFLAVAARLGLDPFTRQIHAIKDKNRNQFFIHVGIDGRRAIAQRTGMVDGTLGPFWCGEDGEWKDVWLADTAPKAAKVGILKRGSREPYWGVANLRSFQTGNPNWRDRPEHMLAKVAEDHALRKAFPFEMGGIPTAYSPERDQGTEDVQTFAEPQEQHEEGEYREIDQETGEITHAGPSWAGTPLGAEVSALVDQLTEAGARFSLPADDADEETLRGWVAAKRGLLNQKGR